MIGKALKLLKAKIEQPRQGNAPADSSLGLAWPGVDFSACPFLLLPSETCGILRKFAKKSPNNLDLP